jgi:hypothetical protein
MLLGLIGGNIKYPLPLIPCRAQNSASRRPLRSGKSAGGTVCMAWSSQRVGEHHSQLTTLGVVSLGWLGRHGR